ncbi:Cholesterol 7-alpha-monooxygenase [Ceratobasidium sp. 414]|nr:Cholesterol 7-alpha-monooxygenase [Ceratobasidium sp. 414]
MGKELTRLRLSQELGPVFGVRAFGTTLYHVVDADLIMDIYERPEAFSAFPMRATFPSQVFGLSMQATTSSDAVGKMTECLHRQLSPPHFRPLLSDFVTHARSQIGKLPSNTPFSLLSIAIQPMRNADCAMLLGSSFLASHYDHEIATAFKTFDSNVPLLAVNFPASLMPTTVAARQTLLNTLCAYFDAGLPDDASLLLKEFVTLAQSQGWTTHDLAACALGLMWPLLANAPYVAYWLLAFHLHRPEGIRPLVQEVNWVMASGRDLSEVVQDSSATPYLDACIDETIRLASDSYSMRWVAEGGEHRLGGYVFKSGDQVACNTRGVHMDAEVYPQPEHFEPERFMDGGKEKLKGQFIPFGGGFSACNGRHLALTQIKALILVLLSEFDISLEDEQQTVPGFSPSGRGFGMIRPVGDMSVRLMRKKYVFGPSRIVDSPLEEYPPDSRML